MNWLNTEISLPSDQYYQRALVRQSQLTKPKGALGLLEEIAVRLAAMQKSDNPQADAVWISIFVADHGIAQESVSLFPQSVTGEMLSNFVNGGAAINVLARQVKAKLEVIDNGVLTPIDSSTIINERAGAGTANFLQYKAMTDAQLDKALMSGKASLTRAMSYGTQLYLGGEMGIGNTTSASACASAILGVDVIELTGAGTGLDNKAILRKAEIISRGIDRHSRDLVNPLAILQCLGGFEIAALVGAFLHAAQLQIPVIVDGFIATVAALIVAKMQPNASHRFFYAHCSKEKGHQLILKSLAAKPILDVNMRLGEATGAALVIPIIRSACALHNQMATFEQAKISR